MGSKNSAPEPPDPMAEVRAQILLEQEQARMAEEARLAQEERDRIARDERIATRNEALSTARGGAQAQIAAAFGERGIDDLAPYQDLIGNEMTRRTALVGPEEQTPALYFDDISDAVLASATDRARRGYQRDINQFAAPGFAEARLPGTADDAIISAILGEQATTAENVLRGARERGQIDEAGFAEAQRLLGQQRTAADAELQDIGAGILSGFRSDLRDIGTGAREAAGTFEIGDIFDPGLYRGRIDTRAGEFQERLPGAVRTAVGGREFFDPNDLLTRAGIRRGPTNPSGSGEPVPALANAIAAQNERRNQSRGLGTEGAF